MPFSHIVVGTNNLEAATAFYDGLLPILGFSSGNRDGSRCIYSDHQSTFIVKEPINGEPASYANGGTIGFVAASVDAVNAFHKTGIETGGTAIEDPPGIRIQPRGKFHIAYLRDLDGNKLAAVHGPMK